MLILFGLNIIKGIKMNHKEEFYKQCLILDFETTSTNYVIAEVIEAGFVIRESNEWVIFQELHKPINTPIPPLVESITYITNKMVENSPSFIDSKDVFQSVVDGFVDGYAIGHNYFYDMKVGQNYGINFPDKSICTFKLAKKLFNGVPEIDNLTLPYLRFALELDVPIELYCHRAGNDSFMTGKLLEFFVDMMEVSGIIDTSLPYGPQIMEYTNKPFLYDTMPFGKHKGERFENIPKSYWDWAKNKTNWFDSDAADYDPDLAASINAVL